MGASSSKNIPTATATVAIHTFKSLGLYDKLYQKYLSENVFNSTLTKEETAENCAICTIKHHCREYKICFCEYDHLLTHICQCEMDIHNPSYLISQEFRNGLSEECRFGNNIFVLEHHLYLEVPFLEKSIDNFLHFHMNEYIQQLNRQSVKEEPTEYDFYVEKFEKFLQNPRFKKRFDLYVEEQKKNLVFYTPSELGDGKCVRIGLDIINYYHPITKLILHYNCFLPNLRRAKYLTQLKHLHIIGPALRGEDLHYFSQITHLTLESNTNIKPSDIQTHLPNLEYLNGIPFK